MERSSASQTDLSLTSSKRRVVQRFLMNPGTCCTSHLLVSSLTIIFVLLTDLMILLLLLIGLMIVLVLLTDLMILLVLPTDLMILLVLLVSWFDSKFVIWVVVSEKEVCSYPLLAPFFTISLCFFLFFLHYIFLSLPLYLSVSISSSHSWPFNIFFSLCLSL